MISDFGRVITFKKVRTETTPATLVVQGMISDPMIATELEVGGLEQRAAFEIRIKATETIPAGWVEPKDWAKVGRHVLLSTHPQEFRVMAISVREGSAWISMRIEAIDPNG